MRKIRDFKLPLHYKELRRRGRKTIDFPAAGVADDAALLALLGKVSGKLRPAVLFESFGADSEATARLSPVPGLGHTLGLATLGPGFGEAVAEETRGNPEKEKLLSLAATAALEDAVQFVTGLLKDEVEAERCQLSPIHYLEDPAALEAVLSQLPADRIGVTLTEGRLVPGHTVAFCLSWLAARGRSRTSGPAKRK